MKKKTLGILITLGLITGIVSPAASVLADTGVVPASTYGITYEAHVQSVSWQKPVITADDKLDISSVTAAGTEKRALRLEALKITGVNLPAGASITYEAHVQHDGWQSPVTVIGNQDINGVPVAGTTGKSRRLEAVKITLSGLPGYAVTYQVHVQNKGWLPAVTVENGTDINDADYAGTTAQALRLEALRIEIIKTSTEKAAEAAALTAVATAENSKSQADIFTASVAVNAVKDAALNASLSGRLQAISGQ